MLVLHLSLSTYIHTYMSTYLCKHVFLDLFIFVCGGSGLMPLSLPFPSLFVFRLYSANNLLKCSLTLRWYHGMALKIYSLRTTSVSFFFLAICFFLFCFSPKINSNVIFTIEGSDVSDKKSFMVRYGHPHSIFLHCGPAIHHTSLNNLNLNRCSKTSIEVSLSCSGLAVPLSMAVQISLDIFSINILDKLIKWPATVFLPGSELTHRYYSQGSIS